MHAENSFWMIAAGWNIHLIIENILTNALPMLIIIARKREVFSF